MPQNSVLLVDDDPKIAKLLRRYFEKEDFLVLSVHDGPTALQLYRDKKPDILVLDLMLPGVSGLDVCRQIRKESDTPILMLTARDEETDRLIGLELGADDYVSKPFSPREVVARVKAILRRTRKTPEKADFFRTGKFIIDFAGYTVSADGIVLDLTPTEYKIFELLATHPGQVFTRFQMVEQVQGVAFEGYERTIDAHVKNLRRKIDDNPKDPRIILTVYGVGYKFAGDAHA
ncbi:MAG TPA: response regulator transcription factor [Negativicutes bacterium]|nr:response regulator transcription factor [Negativicutes bacterium]